MKLKHDKVGIAYRDKTFDEIYDIDTMCKKIYDNSIKLIPLLAVPENYDAENNEPFDVYSDQKTYRGDMFEIFVECFLNVFQNDKRIGVKNVKPIPLNEDLGVDFIGNSTYIGNDIVVVQAKFRSNPKHQFTYRELATFMSTAANTYKAFGRNQILITTSSEAKDRDVVNHNIRNINHDIRVIDRTRLKDLLDNNKGFWDDFREAISSSILIPKPRKENNLYDYQEEAISAIEGWLS